MADISVIKMPDNSSYNIKDAAARESIAALPTDIQINGSSIVNNGIANIPIGRNKLGALYVDLNGSYGVCVNSTDGRLLINAATQSVIKSGTEGYKPIVAVHQHESVYYALAKLAGADMTSVTGETVGVYPEAQKAAIQNMFGIEANVPLIETVSGTTPSITGMPNVRYICGEVSTISITPPASGSIVVRFESGSTATTLTVPDTVKWPAWFDATSLDADTTYEIIITDGVYGGVMSWA